MITGAICVVLFIVMYVAADSGEWGPFAVCAVAVLFLIAMACSGRESDKAYHNFCEYWKNGGPER